MSASPSEPRICSLLPSATEIVFALGLGNHLVGVTHECDFPAEATRKPRVTASVIDSDGLSSRQIDEAVRNSLEQYATIYSLDHELLERLRPDIILTQNLCGVCAVGTDVVRKAVDVLSSTADVVSLEPRTVSEVLDSILEVGRCTGHLRRALQVTDALRARLDSIRQATAQLPRRNVLTLEWLDPVFVGGHWVPEMVDIAGGRDVLGVAGQPSRQVEWGAIERADPDTIVAMPCGFGLERSRQELDVSPLPPTWSRLAAVQSGEVYVVDGSSYFNRPGPRLVDGVEILGAILHPEVVSSWPDGSFERHSGTARPLM